MTTIGVVLSADDNTLLRKVCKARGEDLSSFVRRAILMEFATLGYLSDEQRKALGLGVK